MSKKIVKKKEPVKEGEIRFRHIKVEYEKGTLEGKGDNVMFGMPLPILKEFKKHIEKVIAHIESKK